VRINVQLVRMQPAANVWAETYDRKLIDIFGVESEVARSVAESLNARLSGREQKALDSVPTARPEAYDQYLRGLAFDLRSFEPSNLRRASDSFRQAVALDPTFALAWARLAHVDASLGYQGADVESKPCERAATETGKALELQPELGEARLAEGAYLYLCKSNLDQAIAALEQARVAMPGNAEVLETMGSVEHRRGAWAESVEHLRQALTLDPRNTRLLGTYALTLAQMRRFTEAQAMAERALEITPDDPAKIAIQIYTYQAQGHLDAADKLLEATAGRPQEVDFFDYEVLQLLYRQRYPEAIEKLRQALAQDLSAIGEGAGDYYYMLGLAQRANGDAEAADHSFAAGQAFLAHYRGSSQSGDTDVYLHSLLCVLAAGRGENPADDAECLFTAKAGAAGGPYAASAREAMARAYALSGNVDGALKLLPELMHTPYYSFLYSAPLTPALLRLDPQWSVLRSDPRFRTLSAVLP
jgi:tetratricopeptide (TPR) repeat protein